MRSRRCVTPTSTSSSGARRARPRRSRRAQRLRRREQAAAPRRADFDLVIVGYPGPLRRAAGAASRAAKPLVFDAVLSLEDELVVVRRRFRPRSTAATVLRAVDMRALRLAGSRRLRHRHRGPLPPVARRGERRLGLPRRRRGALSPPVDADLSVHRRALRDGNRRRRFGRRRAGGSRVQRCPDKRRVRGESRPTTWESRSRTPGSCSGASASRGRSRRPSSTRWRPARP